MSDVEDLHSPATALAFKHSNLSRGQLIMCSEERLDLRGEPSDMVSRT